MTREKTTMPLAIIVRALRIWSGLFLLAFVTSHLTNLSSRLGLDRRNGQRRALTFRGSGPGQVTRNSAAGIPCEPLPSGSLGDICAAHFAHQHARHRSTADRGACGAPAWRPTPIGISMAANAGLEPWICGCDPPLLARGTNHRPAASRHAFCGLGAWVRGPLYLAAVERKRRSAAPLALPSCGDCPGCCAFGLCRSGSGNAELQGITVRIIAQSPAMPENVVVPFAQIRQITNVVIIGSFILAALTLAARLVRLTLQTTQDVFLVRDGGPQMTSSSALSILDGFQRNDRVACQPLRRARQVRDLCGAYRQIRIPAAIAFGNGTADIVQGRRAERRKARVSAQA